MKNSTGVERETKSNSALKKHVMLYAGFLVLALALLLVLNSGGARADDVGGTYDTDTTLTYAGSPYYMTDDVIVTEDATLYIEDGVEIYFDTGYSFDVYGAVEAGNVYFYSGDNIDLLLRNATIDGQLYLNAENDVALDIINLDQNGNGIYIENGGSTDVYIQDAYIDTWPSGAPGIHIESLGDVSLVVDVLEASSWSNVIEVYSGGDAILDVSYADLTSDFNAIYVDADGSIDADFNEVVADSSNDGIALLSDEDIKADFSAVVLGWDFYGDNVGISVMADSEADVSMVDSEVYGYYSALAEIFGPDGVTFSADNCTFDGDDYAEDGLVIFAEDGLADVEVIDCEFTDIYGSASWTPGMPSEPYDGALSIMSGNSLDVTIGTAAEGNLFDNVGTAIVVACAPAVNSTCNMSATNNTIDDAEYGILVGFLGDFEETVGANNLELNVKIEGNLITNTDYGIGVYFEFGSEVYASSANTTQTVSINFGVKKNEVNYTYDAISVFIYGEASSEELAEVINSCSIEGTVDISDNNIIQCFEHGIQYSNEIAAYSGQSAITSDVSVSIKANSVDIPNADWANSYGIYVYEDAGAEHDNATAQFLGSLTICNNEVTAADWYWWGDRWYNGYAIFVQRDGWSADDNASVEFDLSATISKNEVSNAEGTSLEYGIYVEDGVSDAFEVSGDNAAMNLHGEVLITYNTISGDVQYGIWAEHDAYVEYDNATLKDATDLTITNNAVDVAIDLGVHSLWDGAGIGFWYYDYAESDNASACVAMNLLVSNNDIITDYGYGIDAEWEMDAFYDNATVDATVVMTITDNVVESAPQSSLYIGIYAFWEANAQDGNAKADVEADVTVADNVVDATVRSDGEGLYLEAYAEVHVYNPSMNPTAILTGDVVVEDNDVTLVGDSSWVLGMYTWYEAYVYADDSCGIATADLAQDFITRNNVFDVTSTGSDATGIYYGVEADVYKTAAGDAIATVSGENTVEDNTIAVSGEECYGIYSDVEAYMSTNYYGNSSALVGEITYANNCISIIGDSSYGIYVDMSGVRAYGYYVYSALSQVESINVVDNTVTLLSNYSMGICVEGRIYALSYYGENDDMVTAEATVNILRNTVKVTGYTDAGIGVYFESGGYSFYAYAYYGNATVKALFVVESNKVTMDDVETIGIAVDESVYEYSYQGTGFVDAQIHVLSNTVSGAYRGIYVEDWWTGETSGNFVSSNAVSECVYGIYLNDIENFVVAENTLCQNGIDQDGYGLYVDECSNVTFEGNLIKENEYGVYIYDCYEIYFNNNEVSYSRYYGAYFNACDLLSIECNTFKSNKGTGVYLEWNDDVVFGNNTVASNGENGLVADHDDVMRMFNGIFSDNLNYGVDVEGGANDWFVDANCEVRNNAVYFEGSILVQAGGVMTIDTVNDFVLAGDDHGSESLKVEEGGSLVILNSVIDGWWYIFEIRGNLDMDNTKVMGGDELYLGPTCTADIRGSTIVNMIGNGIHIDNCSPTIAGTIVALNGKDGIFIEGDEEVSPIIQGCTIAANARGIYTNGANLGRVIDNLITMNSVAGVYVLNGSGQVLSNTFELNKVEIYLVGSDVQVCGNHIGYSSQIDRVYTLMLVLGEFGDVDDWYWAATPEMVADLLVNHIGIYAEDSTLATSGNSYGMLTTAVYAIDSEVEFGDNITPCGCESATVWYLSEELEYAETPVTFYDEYVLVNASIPTEVVDGLFLQGSELTADGSTIQVADTALFLDDSTANLSNCTLLAGEHDFYLVNGSVANATDVTYETAEVQDDSALNLLSAQKPNATIFGMDPGVLVAVVLIIVIAILLGVFLLRRKK